MKTLLLLLFSSAVYSVNAQSYTLQLPTGDLRAAMVERGFTIATVGETITTGPMVIYSNGPFYINIRLIVTADTIRGEYATTTKLPGNLKWSPITNRAQCRLSWKVYSETVFELKKLAAIARN